MRQMIDFAKDPCIFWITDEEYAEWELKNKDRIEYREKLRGHDEAQALYNAERKGRMSVVKEMLQNGMSIELASQVSNFSLVELEQIYKEL